jgi:hypothetical protein
MIGVNRPHISIWQRVELLALVLGSILFIALACTIAQTRLLWYDEIFTLQVVNQGSWGRIMAALHRGQDLQPPLFFLLTKWTRPFGGDELGLRLPAILGFVFAGVSLYAIARRWFSAGFAVAAMAAPWILFFDPLGVEARPYGLMMGFASLALLGWTFRDRRPLIGRMSYLVGMFGASMVHYYGFLVAFPFGVAAIWSLARRRRLDVWSLAGCACAGLPNVWNYPMIRDAIAFYRDGAWNPPSWSKLLESPYRWELAALAGVWLAGTVAARFWKSQTAPPHPDAETLVCWTAFCAIPIVALILAKTISGMVTPRYYSMYALGYGLLLTYLVARLGADSRWLGYVVGAASLAVFLHGAHRQEQVAESERARLLMVCADFESLLGKPVYSQSRLLMGDSLFGMQMAQYCPAIRARMVFGADPALSRRYMKNDTVHKGLLHLRGSFPLNIEPLGPLLHAETRPLLVFDSGSSFMKKYLTEEAEFAGRYRTLDQGATYTLYSLDPAATNSPRGPIP